MARTLSTLESFTIRGFKSHRDETTIAIRPLTLLCGSNSSGKTSVMQPLLLLKQTLEAPGDPGTLLLEGPNVRFTSAEQLLWNHGRNPTDRSFSIRLELSDHVFLECTYKEKPKKGFDIHQMTYEAQNEHFVWSPAMTAEALDRTIPRYLKDLMEEVVKQEKSKLVWRIVKDRCFLALDFSHSDRLKLPLLLGSGVSPSSHFRPKLMDIIHLPGLRGNPRRTYAKTGAGPGFPGTFEDYVASLIAGWQESNLEKLREAGRLLSELGLSWKVQAKSLSDTQVELRVGRLPQSRRGGASDLISVADMGFGVSQALPVLVALIEARPGQVVYLEQPEIHLHPRAQRRLAWGLAKAARRGVRLVVETHSALLLREVQILVAQGELDPKLAMLHWFQRDPEGATIITSRELDERGAFGDWPADFDDTDLASTTDYLDAVENQGAKP